MNTKKIIQEIDIQIHNLTTAKSAMLAVDNTVEASRGPGRPAGSLNKPSAKPRAAAKKYKMSEEGRARISAAQKKRHAALRKDKKKGALATASA